MPDPTRREQGQSTVELALALPVLVLFLLAGAQLTVIARDQLAVIHAAREAARAAAVSSAVSADGSAAGRDATELGDVTVSVTVSGSRVQATVTRVVRTDVPLVGPLLPDVTVRAVAVMQREP